MRTLLPLLITVLVFCLAHQAVEAGDNGDGTYTNPPLYADFPDPDIIRVDDNFYMVSTTFVNSPGLAVLHSKDLVNWSTIGNVIDRLQGHPGYDMIGGPLYRNGVFAPSIRYHNGTFYVAVQPNGTGQGLQIYHTQDPAGDWQLNQLSSGGFDPGLFFDDDGTPYVIHGGAWQNNITIRELTPNLDGFASPNQVIHTHNPGLEGVHVIKRDNYYYMFHSAPGQLAMYMSRSTSLFGDWETRRVIDDGSGSGHQGGVVQLPNGEWYGFAMLDSGPIGRVTNISPVTWENDWPVWGNNDVIPDESFKPIAGQPIIIHPQSTGFDQLSLSPDYRWNHNPDNSRWSLSERPGYLRLKPTVSPDFWNARNTLTYKGFGPVSQAVVEMDISNLQAGDVAGLGMLGKGLATLAIKRLANGQSQLVLGTGTATANSGPIADQTTVALGSADTVHLLLRMDFEQSQGQTAYSLDGTTWNTIGSSFPLLWDWATGTFQGEQYAIFNYNAAASLGYVDVNRMSFVQRSDIDRDGDVDAADFQRLAQFHLASLAADSPLETFAYGDIDGDLDNDYQDFLLFQEDYTNAYGATAFGELLAESKQVPEQQALTLVFVWLMAMVSGCRLPATSRFAQCKSRLGPNIFMQGYCNGLWGNERE